MHATLTEVLPAQKSSPHNAINWTPADSGPGGFLTIHSARKSTDYLVVEFPTSWEGRAFHFAKVTKGTDPTAESYDTFICYRSQGRDSHCSCKGFMAHRTCKHIDSANALIDNGWLPNG
jgi:hypothetical protein